MKKISLLIVCILFSCTTLAAGPLLPFLPQPQGESTAADSFQLQQRFLDFELEMGKVMDEMRALASEQAKFENQLDAFYITGSGFGQMRRFYITGDGKGQAKNFLGLPLWYDGVESEAQTQGSKANQRIYLTIVGKPSEQIEVASSIIPSAVWGGSPSLRLDNVAIKTNFSGFKTTAGTFWAEFSPLTLYYPKAKTWFESSYFTRVRTQWEEEQGIVGNKRKLEGLSLEYDLDNIFLQGFMSKVKDSSGNTRHRFLTGYAVNVIPFGNNLVGANWLRLADDPVSGGGSAMNAELLGLNWNWKLWRNLSTTGEVVRSQYDNSVTETVAAAEDLAAWCELRWDMKDLIVQLRSLKVGPYYYAPASQSRTYNLSDLTRFGAESSITAMGGTVANADKEALPYGLATPNRKGYQVRALYAPGGRVQAAFERTDLHQVQPTDEDGTISQDAPRYHYVADCIGTEVDLTGLVRIGNRSFPRRKLKLAGQLEKRTRLTVDSPERFDETLVDWGFAYELRSGWNLLLGGKNKNSDGTKHKSTVLGLEVMVSPHTTVCVSGSNIDFVDAANSQNNYQGKVAEVSLKTYF